MHKGLRLWQLLFLKRSSLWLYQVLSSLRKYTHVLVFPKKGRCRRLTLSQACNAGSKCSHHAVISGRLHTLLVL